MLRSPRCEKPASFDETECGCRWERIRTHTRAREISGAVVGRKGSVIDLGLQCRL